MSATNSREVSGARSDGGMPGRRHAIKKSGGFPQTIRTANRTFQHAFQPRRTALARLGNAPLPAFIAGEEMDL